MLVIKVIDCYNEVLLTNYLVSNSYASYWSRRVCLIFIKFIHGLVRILLWVVILTLVGGERFFVDF
jgi:hypothetical protein